MVSFLRRVRGSRSLTSSLALAAVVTLSLAPVAAAQSTAQADGAISVGSLGSTYEVPGRVAGSLGSLAGPAYPEYVALGDSYAAFGDQTAPADGEGPARQCARSLTDYPRTLDANPAVGGLTDATCGGAVTKHFFEAQYQGVAPQLEALEAGTDLVTLSIGGNDVGFAALVGCITRQGPFAQLPPSARCEDQLGATTTAAIDSVYGKNGRVDAIYTAIEDASPDAAVIATQYLPLMPAEGTTCAITEQLNPADVQWAREVAAQINIAVDEAARRAGHVSVLPTDNVDRSVCAAADARWTDFQGGPPTNAAPFHPTALGQQAMAAAIAAIL